MSQGQESLTTAQWMYARLAADATLAGLVGTRIYADLAPETATMPCVVFQMQSGRDLTAAGAIRVLSNQQWLVRGIAEGNSYGGALGTIAQRIDAVLHAASGTVALGTVVACTRSMSYQWTELDAGVQYRHLGGFYEVSSQ